jgi:hypothetical protein
MQVAKFLCDVREQTAGWPRHISETSAGVKYSVPADLACSVCRSPQCSVKNDIVMCDGLGYDGKGKFDELILAWSCIVSACRRAFFSAALLFFNFGSCS